MEYKNCGVKMFDDVGRGVVALKDFAVGEEVARCELLVFSKKDTDVLNETALYYYTFQFDEDRACLPLGIGSLFNHAPESNTSYEIIDNGHRKVMQYKCIKEIKTGDQLFINYFADYPELKIESYFNKNLIE